MIEDGRKRLFVDLDGTAVKWRQNVTLEEITAPGFFLSGEPVENVCQAVNNLAQHSGLKVCILSAVFDDDHLVNEKKAWVRKYIPEIPKENMFFPRYGEPKGSVLGCVTKDDYLLDDNSEVLRKWDGTGVKIYTAVNGNHGTWRGYSVNANMTADILEKQLCAICWFC